MSAPHYKFMKKDIYILCLAVGAYAKKSSLGVGATGAQHPGKRPVCGVEIPSPIASLSRLPKTEIHPSQFFQTEFGQSDFFAEGAFFARLSGVLV
jgi:hypothetical protein